MDGGCGRCGCGEGEACGEVVVEGVVVKGEAAWECGECEEDGGYGLEGGAVWVVFAVCVLAGEEAD